MSSIEMCPYHPGQTRIGCGMWLGRQHDEESSPPPNPKQARATTAQTILREYGVHVNPSKALEIAEKLAEGLTSNPE